MLPTLDERGRREWAASAARALGRGGISLVHRATGLSRTTITRGVREIDEREASGTDGSAPPDASRRVRRGGGGRRKAAESNPELLGIIERLFESATPDERRPLFRWTLKSLRTLSGELGQQGHELSYRALGRLLKGLGYGLWARRKSTDGHRHPAPDEQFRYIAAEATRRLGGTSVPVVAIDVRRRELTESERSALGRGRADERSAAVTGGRLCPLDETGACGTYDVGNDGAWKSTEIGVDTAGFTAASLGRWWDGIGGELYTGAEELFVIAASAGGDGNDSRLWKLELQTLADRLERPVTSCHIPPGTSRWSRIEHRLYSVNTGGRRGTGFHDRATAIELVGSAEADAEPAAYCALDALDYGAGRKVGERELSSINLHRHRFHGDWNYTIKPRPNTARRVTASPRATSG